MLHFHINLNKRCIRNKFLSYASIVVAVGHVRIKLLHSIYQLLLNKLELIRLKNTRLIIVLGTLKINNFFLKFKKSNTR